MKNREFMTIREFMYWNYSNVAMAHFALENSHLQYDTSCYIIRAKLFKGLCTGEMHISTVYDDEKYKLKNHCCCYCGTLHNLSLDHLIPRNVGGSDAGDNLVYACKKCNSSKNDSDLIVWALRNNTFPPILVLRRYLKLAIAYFEKKGVIDLPFDCLLENEFTFRVDLLPYAFPQPSELKL